MKKYLAELMDGSRVKRIVFKGENPEIKEAHPGQNHVLIFSYGFHGEYDDAWIIELTHEREIARHNVQAIASIFWEETP